MLRAFLFIIMLSSQSLVAEDPWGPDADLLQKGCRTPCKEVCPSNFLIEGARVLIRFHQEVISPADGPRSHYCPSSSQYTLDAIRKYGFFYGWLLGCDRLMRENDDPWVYKTAPNACGLMTKIDPVP